jgi:SAM-dependent methyltransferase
MKNNTHIKDFLFKIKINLMYIIHSNKLKNNIVISDDNKEYINTQLKRSLLKKDNDTSSRIIKLVDKISKKTNLRGKKILCIGCRSLAELKYFKTKNVKSAIGIDLFSKTPEILIMDMHKLMFKDDSFDLIFSCHSLEHSQNYQAVLSEFLRVVRKEGIIVIEVPVNYRTNEADLWDFKSISNFKKIINIKNVKKVLFQEVEKKSHTSSGTDVMRFAFIVNK